jgi:hypothetical protein
VKINKTINAESVESRHAPEWRDQVRKFAAVRL